MFLDAHVAEYLHMPRSATRVVSCTTIDTSLTNNKSLLYPGNLGFKPGGHRQITPELEALPGYGIFKTFKQREADSKPS